MGNINIFGGDDMSAWEKGLIIVVVLAIVGILLYLVLNYFGFLGKSSFRGRGGWYGRRWNNWGYMPGWRNWNWRWRNWWPYYY